MLDTAVIIAGGQGSRLKPLSNNKPKAMVLIRGRPMLYWVIQWLKRQGIRKLVVGVAYKKNVIVEYLKKNASFGLEVHVSAHTIKGGTAQAFRLAIQRFVTEPYFLAMNCDEITNLKITHLVAVHKARQPLVTMALAPFHCRFSVVDCRADGYIHGFNYGRILKEVPVSIGVYIFSRRIWEHIPLAGSIEHTVFTPLSRRRQIAFYRLRADEQWISVNDVKNVREVEANPHLLWAPQSRRARKTPNQPIKIL